MEKSGSVETPEVLQQLHERAAVAPVDCVDPGWKFYLLHFSLDAELVIQYIETLHWK